MHFVVLALLLFIAAPVRAENPAPAAAPAATKDVCNCTEKDENSRWHDAAAVFTGTVAEIKVIEKEIQYGNEDLPVEVTLLINDGYKNAKPGDKFVLHTNLARKTCMGHAFEVSRKYLVFAYARKEEVYEPWSLYNFPSGTYDVGGACGGTKDLEDPRTLDDAKFIKEQLKKKPAKPDRDLRLWRSD